MTRCRFATDRLTVGEWHDTAARFGLDLPEVVGRVMTAATTAELPPEWHGGFDAERAACWITERDAESPTLLVIERENGEAVGFLVLFEVEEDGGLIDLRLGYVLAEDAWGRGFASELVAGLVGWAATEPSVAALSGGVAVGNDASSRVLLKNGFEPAGRSGGEETYRRTFDRCENPSR